MNNWNVANVERDSIKLFKQIKDTKDILENPQLRIGEIAVKVGISDACYFSSMFKK